MHTTVCKIEPTRACCIAHGTRFKKEKDLRIEGWVILPNHWTERKIESSWKNKGQGSRRKSEDSGIKERKWKNL